MGWTRKALGVLTLAASALLGVEANAATLDRIRETKTLRIAYDPGAPPFSYIVPGSPPTAQPQGYSIELCRALADQFKEQLKLPDLKIVYVTVDSKDRFDVITQDKADLLCESATATLSRRQIVDFSLPIFIDGASFIIRPDGPRDVKFLAGKKVAVLPGTTTEQELRRALTGTHIDAEIVLVNTNQEGIDAVEKGIVAAYFADRATLTFLLRKEKAAANLLMAETYLSVEPIALALRKGDSDFRLAVDTALSHIYRRGEITVIFKTAFGVLSTPSPILASLYQISGLPD
ncbi:MAG: amino acid ABC transporter substrate-binding protein [Alphaproteobacteria bacterium]|nr:amino acid ABC transporter substrate-binding protein [Alphaproteobacteria bacterium]MBV8406332.1 amino acid ABC transporter substrate-binding protein [Alphaproteobacteria bacterium]